MNRIIRYFKKVVARAQMYPMCVFIADREGYKSGFTRTYQDRELTIVYTPELKRADTDAHVSDMKITITLANGDEVYKFVQYETHRFLYHHKWVQHIKDLYRELRKEGFADYDG